MDNRKRWVAWALIIGVMSVVYSLAMFRGLEGHSSYFGNAYQALYPESFSRDAFVSFDRPTILSIYYLIVRFFGDLWLDDRVTLLVFAGLTAISLIGLDKTAQLLGAERRSERIAILSLMLLEHRFFDNHALFMDNYDFNATALACPVIIWLLYAVLAGCRLRVVIPLMVLAPLVSVKNAWLPMLLALVLLWKDRLGDRGKRVVGLIVLAVGALGLGGYYVFLRPGDGTDVLLFDYVLHYLDEREANPFWNPLLSNIIFVMLCASAFVIKGIPPSVLAKVRRIAGVGLAVWLVGGLYLTFAPDVMKIPYLIPFDVTRALWWPQYVLFLTIGVSLLKSIQRAPSWRGAVIWWGILMILYLLHIQFRLKLAVMVLVATLGMLCIFLWRKRMDGASGRMGIGRWRVSMLDPEMCMRIVAIAMCISTLSLYGVGTLSHRLSDLKHLVLTGIMGNNVGAKWVGVNEYMRERTPLSATVLAMSIRDGAGGGGRLHFDGSLRTRTGRSMPFGHRGSFYFDYPKMQWFRTRADQVEELIEAWEREDDAGVSQYLSVLGSPDYLVVPISRSAWLHTRSGFPYKVEASVGDYTIFRKAVWG